MQTIFIRDGFWQSFYEPPTMPGLFIRTRYVICPADSGGMVKDGEYKGLVIDGDILRLVFGGEYLNGFTVNHDFRDFRFTFDDDFHARYLAGAERGYNGKRAVSDSVYSAKPPEWQEGYRKGRWVKKEQRQNRSQ